MKQTLVPWLFGLATLGACTSPQQHSQALIEQGRYREGLAQFEQALLDRPGDTELRVQHVRVREQVIARLLLQAGSEAAAGQFEAAAATYRQVQELDANHERAAAGLAAIEAARRHQLLAEDARARLAKGDAAAAELMAKAVLVENPGHAPAREIERQLRERERALALAQPALRSRLQAAVTLEFRDAPLRQILEALSRSAGINFVLDREVRPDLKASLFVKGVRVEDALDMLLMNIQLEKKLLSDNTVLVYPPTPQKLREYQELVMRTFYLGNADAKQTVNLLRTMLKTKDLFVDERTNMIVMRDTPDTVRAAERLIAAQDLADPEVMLEIEILEVSRNKVRDLGITLPSEFSGPTGRLNQIGDLTRASIAVDTGFKLKLLRTDGETKTLANPRVRVRHREKARVHIGDRVPVISSSIVGTSGGGSSGQPVTTEQIQYLDVGIKIEAEATIHPDDTVGVRISLDVSSLGAQTKTNAGTTAYEVGTRNASTVLRLRDGETQALMGLIRDDDIQAGQGVPFFGEAPVLDRIFGNRRTDRRSRELVLLITPLIVRGVRPPDSTLTEFWSGTEATLRLRAPFVQPKAELTRAGARADESTTVRTAPGLAAPATAPNPSTSAPVAASSAASPAALPAVSAAAATAAARPASAPSTAPPETPLGAALSWRTPPPLRAGAEALLVLQARAVSALKGASVQLRYDADRLEVLEVQEGEFFGRAGKTVFAPRIDARLGIIFATVGSADAVASGEGVLLKLRVRPRAAGLAKLQLAAGSALDAAGQPVPVQDTRTLELNVAL